MKIAMMVRSFLETPVPNDIAYSPATVARSLAEGLTRLGHDVTFYGPEGTDIAVTNIETLGLRPLVRTQQEFDDMVGTNDLFRNYVPGLYDSKMVREMLVAANNGKYDCVIFNHFESALALAPLFPKVPVVHILHDYIDDVRRSTIENHLSPNQFFITVSESQRRDAPDLPYIATIHNGIDLDQFEFDKDAEDYLMFSGRVTPDKGVKEAVQVAVQTGRRLLIAGSLSKNDYWYFDEHVKPFLNDRILYLGMLHREQMAKYYKKAAALLMPIQWQEPFGLSMAEANACGTPVIAFNRGSVPEVIVDKKTGFIVDNSAEMIMAIGKIDTLKRKDCRIRAEKEFTQEDMVKKYEAALLAVTQESSAAKRKRTLLGHDAVIYKIQLLSRRFLRDSQKDDERTR